MGLGFRVHSSLLYAFAGTWTKPPTMAILNTTHPYYYIFPIRDPVVGNILSIRGGGGVQF